MKYFKYLILIMFAAVMIYATGGLSIPGDPASPASGHVSEYYIEHAVEDADTPNIVTAVLADFRSFDTLGETLVIFTATLACVLILARSKRHD